MCAVASGLLSRPASESGPYVAYDARSPSPLSVLSGRVARCGNDSSPFPLFRIGADDDQPPAERGIVLLLHRGVERVHVEMGDDFHRGEFA